MRHGPLVINCANAISQSRGCNNAATREGTVLAPCVADAMHSAAFGETVARAIDKYSNDFSTRIRMRAG
jgi:hypothetical protein